VFKDANRFKHIVKENHFLRVVSEGQYKDVITTAAQSLAYNHPSYTYLRINPNYQAGLNLNCLLGLCHPAYPAYMNQKVLEAPAFHRKCDALVGQSPVVAACINGTGCSWPNLANKVDSLIMTSFQMVLSGGWTAASFDGVQQQKLLEAVASVVGVNMTDLGVKVHSDTRRRHLAAGEERAANRELAVVEELVVDINMITPQADAEALRSQIADPAFAQEMAMQAASAAGFTLDIDTAGIMQQFSGFMANPGIVFGGTDFTQDDELEELKMTQAQQNAREYFFYVLIGCLLAAITYLSVRRARQGFHEMTLALPRAPSRGPGSFTRGRSSIAGQPLGSRFSHQKSDPEKAVAEEVWINELNDLTNNERNGPY
jgi:hypothetical protein